MTLSYLNKFVGILETFYTNIEYQFFFYYKIALVNSQHTSSNSIVFLQSKEPSLNASLKISDIQKQIRLRFGVANSVNTHCPPSQHKYSTSISINCIHQTKASSKIYIIYILVDKYKEKSEYTEYVLLKILCYIQFSHSSLPARVLKLV